MIEGNASLSEHLHAQYRLRRDVRLITSYLSPDEAARALEEDMQGLDVLKVDVDNADCLFVEAVTSVLAPKVIHVEINPFFPPEINYRQRLDTLGASPRGLSGCSLGGFWNGSREEYVLLSVEFENAVFIRRDLAPLFAPFPFQDEEAKWLAGFFCHPFALLERSRLAVDSRVWADTGRSVEVRLSLIRAFLETSGVAHELSLARRKAVPTPLVLLPRAELDFHVRRAAAALRHLEAMQLLPISDPGCTKASGLIKWSAWRRSLSAFAKDLPEDWAGFTAAVAEIHRTVEWTIGGALNWQVFKSTAYGECPLGCACLAIVQLLHGSTDAALTSLVEETLQRARLQQLLESDWPLLALLAHLQRLRAGLRNHIPD